MRTPSEAGRPAPEAPYAIGWGWPYPEVCPLLAWRSLAQRVPVREELAKPETSLCLFPAGLSDLPALADRMLPLNGHFAPRDLARYPAWILDLARVNGALVAMPEDVTPTGGLARIDLLKKHGLKMPGEWAALIDQGRYLKKKLGQPGLVLPRTTKITVAILIGTLLSANGVNPMEGLRDLLKHAKALKETYRMMAELSEVVLGLPEADARTPRVLDSLFSIGSAPYFLSYPSAVRNWSNEILQRIRAFPLPTGPSLSGSHYRPLVKGSAWGIPRNTRTPELALKAMRLLCRTAVVKKIELSGGHPFTAQHALWKDPKIQRHLPVYRDAKNFFGKPPIVFENAALAPLGETMQAALVAGEPGDAWLERLRMHASAKQPAGLKHQALRQAVRRIDENLEAVLEIQELAREAGVSVTHLERLFRSEMGTSCGKYLRTRRMEYARDLLIHSEQAIKEIAYRLGYAHPTHFSRDIRTYWKQTPAQLRAGRNPA